MSRFSMNVVEFLQDLAARGERLTLIGDSLHYSTSAPTPDPDTVESIRAHRNELINWLRESAEPDDCHSLSAGQQGLLMAWRMDPRSPIYNIVLVARLRSCVALDTLHQALQALTDRHPVLRSHYMESNDGQPMMAHQSVESAFHMTMPVVDGSDWSSEAIDAWIEAEADRPFDLEHGPVVRTSVLKSRKPDGTNQWLLHWTMHHIVSDFQTQEILIEDLESLYCALYDGKTPEPCPTGLSHRDFVRWEQDILSNQGDALRQYWQKRIGQWPPAAALPTDLISAPACAKGHDTYRSAVLTFEIDSRLRAELHAFSRKQQTSFFTLLLAAFQIVLARYCGSERFVLSTPTSVRHLSGWDRAVGYYINPVCLEADLSGAPSVTEALRRVQECLNQAFEHQMFPFHEALRLTRQSGTGWPSFGFVLNSTSQPAQAPRLFDEIVCSGQRGAPESISLSMFDMAGVLSGQFTYDANRYSEPSLRRLSESLHVVLDAMIADPMQSVQAVPLIGSTERSRILDQWSGFKAPAEHDKCDPPEASLSTLFVRQAARTPDKLALTECDENGEVNATISYGDLDRWSDVIAHRLLDQGAGSDVIVGVYIERSIAMVAGLLGILKSGAAYLPLDPGYPCARLAYMLEDSGAPLFLTTARLRDSAPTATVSVTMIEIDAVTDLALPADDGLQLDGPSPDALAYLIYTSGSTGQPKGVQAPHRATVNRLAWMWRTMPFESGDVCCQKTALSFVDSVWEIFGPLLQGIPSIILPTMLVRNTDGLIAALARFDVSRLVLVPSLLRSMLEAEPNLGTRLPQLEIWICSGETLPTDLTCRFQHQCPGAQLINLYGSSEVAADVTWYDTSEFTPVNGRLPSRVPIGRPIDNAWCYILDTEREPVAPGVEGELFIGGDCLARGYHQRPEITQERFIANPFAPGRLFRTGDRACWASQTNRHGYPHIAMLGRADSQIKIRGFRVDLSEIAAQLRRHPAVTEAVVQTRHANTDLRLVAVVASTDGATGADLHRFLARFLPDYMIPTGYIILDQLPLTPNGKADLQALAQMQDHPPIAETASDPPAGELEQRIAGIWCQILGKQAIGRHDNFFLLGGHSLLATRIVSRLHNELGVSLPLRAIFEHPTVSATAARIEMPTPATPDSEFAAALSRPRPDAPPLSFTQERLWVLDRFDTMHSAYAVPLALRLRGSLQPDVLHAVLNVLGDRHESLRTTFPHKDGVPYQCISSHIEIPLAIVDLTNASPSALDAALRAEAARTFDLANGPLVRATLLRLGASEHAFLLTLHHIIADGWSLGILSRELDAAYSARLADQPLSLPPLPLHYVDYTLWYRKAADSERWRSSLEAWCAALEDAPTLLSLPTDRPRPPVQDTACASVAVCFDSGQTEALEQLAKCNGASLFMTVFALWSILLGRHGGEDDLVIGVPIAGRPHADLEVVVGCFINALPLRADLSGDPTFSEFLGRVRDTTLDAQSRQNIPVEQILNALALERGLSHSPLFQCMLTVEYEQTHVAARQYRLGNLDASWIDIGRQHTEMDLSLELIRTKRGLTGWIDYSRALFDAETIGRMAGQLRTLVEAAIADPTCAISALPLLTDSEQDRLLRAGIPTSTHGEPIETIQALFEHQVQRTPDAVAVVIAEPGTSLDHHPNLTYAEINARANRLAHRLLAIRLDPGASQPRSLNSVELRSRMIGICMHRSVDMLVTILGVLKAGYAYVPLDPAWPRQRLVAILQDADPFALVVEPDLLDSESLANRILIDMDRDPVNRSTPAAANPSPQCQPEDAAYVMYTSGSTGKPKGVVVEHRNVVGYVDAFVEWTRLSASDRSLQHGSLAFDISIEEFFPPLCVGGSVVICIDPSGVETIVDETIRHAATMICTTPLLTQYFNSRAAELHQVRFLASGGDELRPTDIDQLLAHGVGVYNSYGPTETTVTATSHWATVTDTHVLPIGAPLPNSRALVLDAHGTPVPINVPGELYIGGTGVARGYLNRPALTAEKFVVHELPDGSARLYRTGDRARWRADGALEFVGRMDRQIKIRGFRVELGEIEAAVLQHPGVARVVVLAELDADGQKRLNAYVVPENRAENSVALRAELREQLRMRLPNYMIPAAIVTLEALPMTPTGKIDRKALPATLAVNLTQTVVRPRSVIEQELLAIWREILQNDAVEIFDDFFELGGHSLAAVRLTAQIADAFGTQLPLQALFYHPTVAEMAAHLAQATPHAPWSTLVALQPRGEEPPLFCIPGDGGNVFYFHPLARALGQTRPVYGLESVGLDGLHPPHTSVEAAAVHHVSKILDRWPDGPFFLAGHSFGGLVAFEMVQQLSRIGAPIGMLAILDTLPPSMPIPEATDADLIVTFEGLFAEEYGTPASLTTAELAPLTPEQRLESLTSALTSIGALPSGSGIEHVRNLFSVFRLNTRTEYQPRDVIPVHFELMLAAETPDEAERTAMIEGWSELGSPNVQIVPGSHTTMTYPPHVADLAERLRQHLISVPTSAVRRVPDAAESVDVVDHAG